MKFKFIAIFILFMCSQAHAGWFGWGNDNREQENQRRFEQAQHQLEDQRRVTGGWMIATGALSVGCILLFTIGTAIGARTRRHESS